MSEFVQGSTGPRRPPGDHQGQSPPAAYAAEIRAVEDAFIDRPLREGEQIIIGKSVVVADGGFALEVREEGEQFIIGESVWWTLGGLKELREIDARHGVKPDDPRVYSMAAAERDLATINEIFRKASGLGGPESDWEFYRRQAARIADYRARHFPGVFRGLRVDKGGVNNPAKPWDFVNPRTKLWGYIQFEIESFPGFTEDQANRSVHTVYELLLAIGLDNSTAEGV